MTTAPNPSSGADSRQRLVTAGGDLTSEDAPGDRTSSGAGGNSATNTSPATHAQRVAALSRVPGFSFASNQEDTMTKAEKNERIHYITSKPYFTGKPFAEELRWLVDNPPLGSVPMDITPAMASEMLKYNSGNRPFSPQTAAVYAKQMRKDQWHYTGQPIIFCKSGYLGNGQHTLSGCYQSGTTINAQVLFGVPDDSFAFMDIGRKRTAADIFAINGVKNPKAMAAGMRWVVGYDRGGFSRPGGEAANRMSGAELYDAYKPHTKLQDSFWVVSRFGKSRLASPALMLSLHYICARKCQRDADTFFDIMSEGMGAKSKTDPPMALRNKLINNAINQEKLPFRSVAGLTIVAWNLYRDGRNGRALRFDNEKAFPRAR